MSLELVDLRAKISMQTHLALQAYARAHGLDQSEVVRDILGEWGARQVHAARVLLSGLQREGLGGKGEE